MRNYFSSSILTERFLNSTVLFLLSVSFSIVQMHVFSNYSAFNSSFTPMGRSLFNAVVGSYQNNRSNTQTCCLQTSIGCLCLTFDAPFVLIKLVI